MKKLVNLLFHDVYRHSPAESGFTGSAADRYKLSLPNLLDHFHAIAEVRVDPPALLNAATTSAQGRKVPYTISVDDGGISYYALLADALEQRGWRGHCMVTTGMIGRRGFLSREHIRDLHQRGHLIGSHTHTHPQWFHTCPWDKQVREWRESKHHLEDITGEQVDIGSVPGGYFSLRVARAAREAGLSTLFTSEPGSSIRSLEGCMILGRYSLRHNSRMEHTASLVNADVLTMLGEWSAWNGKKLLKKSLGTRYEVLSDWLHRGII